MGRFVVHYANGEQREIPLRLGGDLLDFHFDPAQPKPTVNSQVAWTGPDAENNSEGSLSRLILMSWSNPLPDAEVQSIDYVSAMNRPTPFLVAITVEP